MKHLVANFRDNRFGLYLMNSYFSLVVSGILISTFLDTTLFSKFHSVIMYTLLATFGGALPMGLTSAALAYLDTLNVDAEKIPEKSPGFEWKSLLVQLLVFTVFFIVGHMNEDFFSKIFSQRI
jgi:hypothetical protein